MRYSLLSLIIMMLACLVSCSRKEVRYHIGVSQCSEDIWRDWQNAELRMEANFHDDVELCFASAYDSSERQIQQIDSLVRSGIDLLIVAPNQLENVTEAIDRVYDSGVPVIVFERKTGTNKYTAFVSADNYEMGRLMGEYIAGRLHGQGRVLEVMGLKGSSPASDRHKGFIDAMSHYPGIRIVASLQGDWTEEKAYQVIKDYNDLENIDFIFGHNDRTAMGARKAFMEKKGSHHLPLFCGIDGLPGENGGIRQVRDSLLDASYIYPTRGDQLLKLALDILEGKPFEKETLLSSALVTHENANVLLLESDEVMRQAKNLEQLHQRASQYQRQLSNQQTITLLAIGCALMFLILMMVIYLYQRQKTKISAERMRMEREQLDFYTQVSHELRTPLTLIEGPLNQLAQTEEMKGAGEQASQTLEIVRRNTRQLSALISKMLDVQVSGTVDFNEPLVTANIPVEPLLEPSHEEKSETVEEKSTILIVDDNADIRTYLKSILRERYQVVEAADGKDGLRDACSDVPDLIVSDVMMPVMNGLEFCQQVKKNIVTSHIPVILLTARALSKHQIEGYESGADAYITKPFSPDLLLARIDNLLRNRHLLKDIWGGAQQKEVESQASAQPAEQMENTFIMRFKHVVEEHMDNSELSVEDIGAELGLSRVQLYRKVKALTGCSPVDLLRKARLIQARQLLSTTDLSVSEVAYKVGFTSPSYFTKCFKDEYQIVPGEWRKN